MSLLEINCWKFKLTIYNTNWFIILNKYLFVIKYILEIAMKYFPFFQYFLTNISYFFSLIIFSLTYFHKNEKKIFFNKLF